MKVLVRQNNVYSKYQHSGLGMGELYSQGPLPVHHQASKNILYAKIHQQLLLLHQLAVIRFRQGEISLKVLYSVAKCIASADTT